MALIVEDGTGVANANSYVDIDFLDAFAAARGLAIPTDDAVKEQYLLRAMDYLEAMHFQGYKADELYSLQWPRKTVVIGGYDFDIDAIPVNLKNAQCQLVVEQQAGHPLWPIPVTSTSKGVVTERTVGPITTKFASTKGIANSVGPIIFPAVQAFLSSLRSASTMRTFRV